MHNLINLQSIKPFILKHEPELLTGMGLSGLIFSTLWGIKATFKVSKKIQNYKDNKNIDKLTRKEILDLSWRDYLPVAVSMGVSIPCVIAGTKVANKRYAALATAYTISETALQEYKEKTKEIVGEKKSTEIQESINADKIDKTYKGGSQVIMTDNGESLFYEPISGRYFKSNWNAIAKAANELNAQAIGNMTGQITLNEWFNKLDLDDVDIGSIMGWDIQRNPTDMIDVSISSHITKDNIPCGAIYYRNDPIKLDPSSY